MAGLDEDEEYEIERILADDEVEGRRYFLVKWKGYPDEQCTWEPMQQFSSPESFVQWEREKADGKGLPDEFIALVQGRMDKYQEQMAQKQGDKHQFNDSSERRGSTRSTSSSEPPSKKQKCEDPSKSIRNRASAADPPHKKGIVRHTNVDSSKTASARTIQRQAPQQGRPFGSANKKQSSSGDKIGQRFRNLSHMNAARKKSRAEPEPNLPPESLKTVAAFDIGRETAHILPPGLDTNSRSKEETPLFVPDTNAYELWSNSPPVTDSPSFPPAMVDHTKEPGAIHAIPSNNSTSTSPLTAKKLAYNTRSAAEPDRPLGLPTNFPLAPMPSKELAKSARNGRTWYHGDIMCNFSMGKPIGDATIIHVPYYPHGGKIVKLKRSIEGSLKLNFSDESYDMAKFHSTFRNSHNFPLELGLISAFPDTQQYFDEFAEYLESNDIAAVFDSSDPGFDISLLLYSIYAKSWTPFGWKPARSGQPRLHVAILPKLIRRQAQSTLVATQHQSPLLVRQDNNENSHDANQIAGPSTMHKTTPTVSKRPTWPRSPSLQHAPQVAGSDVRQAKTPTSPARRPEADTSVPGSPMTGRTTRETTPRTKTPDPSASVAPTRDIRTRRESVTEGNAMARSVEHHHKLDYELVTTYPRHLNRNPKLRLDPKNARFFISFAQSHQAEANLLQMWLETRTKPSNIYLDSERHDWARFREKAEDGISVVFFHEDAPNYHKLPDLYQILFIDIPTAFSVKFGHSSTTKPDLSTIRVRKLFPRATLYLITESMIVESSQETLAVLKYFNNSKKPGYKIMMRPDVEGWLLQTLAQTKEQPLRGTLLDILVLITKLRPDSDALLDSDYDGHRALATSLEENPQDASYIITPSSIPGYDEAATGTPYNLTISHNTTADPKKCRDDIFKEYFNCYAATKAVDTRRFIAFYSVHDASRHEAIMKQKVKDNKLDCGHVFYWELEKFVRKYCQRSSQNNKQVNGIKSPDDQTTGV